MGILQLRCVTTDPAATTFYGFAYAKGYNLTAPDIPSSTNYTVLVKSNTNPASPSELTWSLVSMIESETLTYYDPDYSHSYACAVNAQGVFSVFISFVTPSRKPFGIRYDPGLRAWTNLTVDSKYAWPYVFKEQMLGYVNNVLVHVVFYSSPGTIYFATMNEATKTLIPAGVWAMNGTTHGNVKAMMISDNNLYTIGFGLDASSSFLTSFPLSPTLSSTTPVGRNLNTNQFIDCSKVQSWFLYYNQGVALTCAFSNQQDFYYSKVYVVKDPDNTATVGPPVTSKESVTYASYLVPIGDGNGNGGSFVLMGLYGQLYALVTSNNGSMTSEWLGRASIVEPVGETSSKPPISSSLSVEAIVGIIAGALVVEQIQALQFSSHPRPTVVLGAYGDGTEAVNASRAPPAEPTGAYPATPGAPHGPWQPTPFVPPFPPIDIVGGPSPGTAVSHVVTSPISQDSHDQVSSSGLYLFPPSIPSSSRPSP
ncbi:MAG: hypothetical protein J3R72DRAFT_491232 [Linnemannia gamsii]|nr:MAG: hypothetical protein J3R72DRAFT_491232 [Linnemannia gamsii]